MARIIKFKSDYVVIDETTDHKTLLDIVNELLDEKLKSRNRIDVCPGGR